MNTSFAKAITKTIAVAGTNFVYRELGADVEVPIVMLHHLGAVLDEWDPAVIDDFAKDRRVITFDNRGVGSSEGTTPDTIEAMANDAIAFIEALGLTTVDLIGFSMGGFISQVIAHDRPDLVRRLILAGTGPAGGEGISRVGAVVQDAVQKTRVDKRHPKHILFFTQTEHGQKGATAFLQRLDERTDNRDAPVSDQTFQSHLSAIVKWGSKPDARRPLRAIKQPVLVANGDDDIVVPTPNSIALFTGLPDAQLSIFPDAGHGGIFEHHKEFVAQARAFLA
jgi:pimeloyl-ACP methyl ester carboxylesterase